MTMETVSPVVCQCHCYTTTCCVIYVIALLTGLTPRSQSNVSHRRISHSASIPAGAFLLLRLLALLSLATGLDAYFTHYDAVYKSVAEYILEYSGVSTLGNLIYATADEAAAYMFYRCFFLLFFVFFRPSNMRQPFSGTAERIFMKLLPNDTGENGVCNVVPPPGESRARRLRYKIMSARMDLI